MTFRAHILPVPMFKCVCTALYDDLTDLQLSKSSLSSGNYPLLQLLVFEAEMVFSVWRDPEPTSWLLFFVYIPAHMILFGL